MMSLINEERFYHSITLLVIHNYYINKIEFINKLNMNKIRMYSKNQLKKVRI